MRKKIIITLVIFAITVMATVFILLLTQDDNNQQIPSPQQQEQEQQEQEQNIIDTQQPTNRSISDEELQQEAEAHQEGEEHLQTLENKNPLINYLPYRSTNREFEVYYRITDEENFEVAYPVILHPKGTPQTTQYNNDVERLKQATRNWISSVGINPQTLNIEWRIE